MKQEKTVLEAGFPCAMYELQKAFDEGWRLSETREPLYIAGLYEIVMEKPAAQDVENNEGDLVDNSGGVSVQVNEVGVEANVQVAKRGPKPKGK